MRKPIKIILIVVLSIVILLTLLSLLISPVATNYLNKHGHDLLGRELQVNKVKANLFTGSVVIRDLKLYEDNGADLFISFDTLDVRLRLLRLVVKDLYFSHITLAGPNINIEHSQDGFNFKSIIDHFKTDDDDDDSPSKWGFYFYKIRLSDGRLSYADKERGNDWNIKGLHLLVPGFCIGADQQTDAGLSLELADGGRLHVDAKYNMERNDFQASLNLDDVNIAVAKPYLTDVLNLSALKGTLDAALLASGNLDKITQMNISGAATINKLNMPINGAKPLLSCDRLHLRVKNINLFDKYYNIDSVVVQGLEGRFERFEDGTNFKRALAHKSENARQSSDDTSGSRTKSSSRPLNLNIGHLRVSDSRFTYADHTMADDFQFPMTAINIEADNVSLNEGGAAKLKASLPGGGHLSLRWNGALRNWKNRQDIRLQVKGLNLTQVSPYSVTYLGRPFTDGTFSLSSHNVISNCQLEGKNHVDIFKAEVGKKRRDVDAQVKIPFKTALYILKDKDDKILFDVPVQGDVSSPQFSYSKIIWKAIGNLFVKVATSPIRAIGNAIGVGADIDFIPIDPIQRDFTSEQYHQFAQLGTIVKSSQSIKLILEQQTDTTSDEAMLKRMEYRNQLVSQYLTQQEDVNDEQVEVRTSMIPGLKKIGYAILSETMEAIEE